MIKSRNIAILAAALLIGLGFSCKRETPSVSKVVMSSTEIFVSEGSTVQLSATVKPEGADSKIVWNSLKPNVASVAQDGTVTGITGGKTYVTATAGPATGGCMVNVVAHVAGVKLDRHEALVELDGVILLKATLEPENVYNDTVYWSSSNPGVAVVGNGVVTGMSIGEADITVTTAEGGFTDVCHVSVVSMVKEVQLAPGKTKINIGESTTIAATVLPAKATDKTVSWSSSDNSIATVDADGKVTGVGKGIVTITATANQNGVSGSCEIEVYSPVTGVNINKTELSLYVGDRETLTAQVVPADANVQGVTWSSSSASIAKVNAATGEVTAVKAGTATITAKSKEGNFTATCTVTVVQGTEPVTGIKLDHSSVRLVVGGTVELFADVLPKNAANKGVTWTTTSSTIASVSSAGVITAKDCGTCVIKATTKDGSYVAECKVLVVGFDTGLGGYEEGGYQWLD